MGSRQYALWIDSNVPIELELDSLHTHDHHGPGGSCRYPAGTPRSRVPSAAAYMLCLLWFEWSAGGLDLLMMAKSSFCFVTLLAT